MALEEVGAWLDSGLILPINGKKYQVPEPNAELGLRLEVLMNSANRETDRYRQVLSDQEEHDLYSELLGPAYDEMIADGVSYPVMKLAATTAMIHFVISAEAAEVTWNQGVTKGKAGKPRNSRPATRPTTGAASTTKSRGSTSGTRSRRTS